MKVMIPRQKIMHGSAFTLDYGGCNIRMHAGENLVDTVRLLSD